MHLLMVYHSAYPGRRGGIDAMIHALIGALPEGWRVSIFIPGGWERRTPERRRCGRVTILSMRLRMPRDPERPLRGLLGWLVEFPVTLWRLAAWMREERVDLVHLHTIREYHLYFRLLHWLGGPPYLVTFHGTDALNFAEGTLLGVRGERRVSPLLAWVARGAAAITAVSAPYARLIGSRHPGLAPVHHIPNGIPLDEGEERGEPEGPGEIVPELDLPGRFWLLVGWVEPPKAPDVAIRAWGRLLERFPDRHLLIVGGEPLLGDGQPYYPGYLAELGRLIEASGVAATVRLTGAMSGARLSALFRRAEGLVFPSLREGLPYVLLEAGAARLPVVVSDIPAFAAVVEHERNGLRFATSDPEALAAAVGRVAADPLLARRLGEALRATIEAGYSARTMAAGYLDLYRRLLRP